jgi:hypothetical protein
MSKNHVTKHPHFAEKPAGHSKCVGKNPVKKCPHAVKQLEGHHKWVQKFCDNCPNFASGKGGHGGRYVTSDKQSTLKPGWMKNM